MSNMISNGKARGWKLRRKIMFIRNQETHGVLTANGQYIPYEMECLLCKKWTPLVCMNFFPFMKGGVCDTCRRPVKNMKRVLNHYQNDDELANDQNSQ